MSSKQQVGGSNPSSLAIFGYQQMIKLLRYDYVCQETEDQVISSARCLGFDALVEPLTEEEIKAIQETTDEDVTALINCKVILTSNSHFICE